MRAEEREGLMVQLSRIWEEPVGSFEWHRLRNRPALWPLPGERQRWEPGGHAHLRHTRLPPRSWRECPKHPRRLVGGSRARAGLGVGEQITVRAKTREGTQRHLGHSGFAQPRRPRGTRTLAWERPVWQLERGYQVAGRALQQCAHCQKGEKPGTQTDGCSC